MTRLNKTLIVQRLVGVIFLVAGALKFTPQVEDVPAVLRRAAEHNAGTFLASASQFFSDHHASIQILVAIVMIVTGAIYVLDRGFVRLAALAQIAMLCTFTTFLFTSEGAVIAVVDATFVAFNIWLLVTHGRRQSVAKPQPRLKPAPIDSAHTR